MHQDRTVLSLNILTIVDGVEYRYPCRYGLRRPDVGEKFKIVNSENTGFIVSCKLPSIVVTNLVLEVCFADRGSLYIKLINMLSTEKNVRVRRITRIYRGIGRILNHIEHGDFSGLVSKIKTKISNLQNHLKLKKTSQEQLQCFLENRLSKNQCIFIVDHNLGGGANLYRNRLVEKLIKEGKQVLLLYFVPPS